MLRLKIAMDECFVRQRDLVKESGYSKALISRAISKGELPKDLERFVGAVVLFVEQRLVLMEWLEQRGLQTSALFERVDSRGNFLATMVEVPSQVVEVDGAIMAIAGRTAMHGPSREETLCLARVALHLLGRLRELPIGMDALGEIEVGAGRILLAGCGS